MGKIFSSAGFAPSAANLSIWGAGLRVNIECQAIPCLKMSDQELPMMRISMSDMLQLVVRSTKSLLRATVALRTILFFTRQAKAYRTLWLVMVAVLLSACNSYDTNNNTNAPVISGPPQTSL